MLRNVGKHVKQVGSHIFVHYLNRTCLMDTCIG